MAKAKAVRSIEEININIRWEETTIESDSKEMIRLAEKIGKYAERGDVKNIEDLSKRVVSAGKAVAKAKKALKELKEELKLAEIEESKNSNDIIDQFLAEWKAEAKAYYTKLRNDLVAVRETRDNDQIKKFRAGKSKNELAIASEMRDPAFLDKMLDQEVVNKKKHFIATVEAKAGKILELSGLEIGVDGSINGFVTGEIKSVHVQTIFAGGYNIQCLHYRVLVK